LSQVKSNDGVSFHAHKIILCAQSPVFNAMLASTTWKESTSNEVTLTGTDAIVLRHLLEYLYSGACAFPRDNLV